MFEKVNALDAHAAQIRKPDATTFAIQLADAPQQPLDANEVEFRMELGAAGQEGGVAAPQFHFQRLFRRKQRPEVEALDQGRKLVNQIRRRGRGSRQFDLRGELSVSVWVQRRLKFAQLGGTRKLETEESSERDEG